MNMGQDSRIYIWGEGWRPDCTEIPANSRRQFVAGDSSTFSKRLVYIYFRMTMRLYIVHVQQEFIHRNCITTRRWPAQSPDINIIENIWLCIKIKLQGRVRRIENKDDLFREIHTIWTAITPKYVQRLYQSIPRRL